MEQTRPLQILAQGAYSQREEAAQISISSLEAWSKLWQEVGNGPLPEVNFNTQKVFALFMGSRPTGGYSYELVNQKIDEGKITIELREIKPEPDDMVTMALTSPFLVIALSVSPDENVEVKIQH